MPVSNASEIFMVCRLVVSATGFEGRLLEATGALLSLDPEQTAEAGLNLGE